MNIMGEKTDTSVRKMKAEIRTNREEMRSSREEMRTDQEGITARLGAKIETNKEKIEFLRGTLISRKDINQVRI
jgi:hypothetical protein